MDVPADCENCLLRKCTFCNFLTTKRTNTRSCFASLAPALFFFKACIKDDNFYKLGEHRRVHSSAGIKAVCIISLFTPPKDQDAKWDVMMTTVSERNQSQHWRFWNSSHKTGLLLIVNLFFIISNIKTSFSSSGFPELKSKVPTLELAGSALIETSSMCWTCLQHPPQAHAAFCCLSDRQTAIYHRY